MGNTKLFTVVFCIDSRILFGKIPQSKSINQVFIISKFITAHRSSMIISQLIGVIGAALYSLGIFYFDQYYDQPRRQRVQSQAASNDLVSNQGKIKSDQILVQDTKTSDYGLIISMFILGISVISFAHGSQRQSEQQFLNDCIDQQNVQLNSKIIQVFQILGAILSCILASLFEQLTLYSTDNTVLNFNMTIGMAITIIYITLMVLNAVLFHEISKDSKNIYHELKNQNRRNNRVDQDFQQLVDDYTLSGYHECNYIYYKIYFQLGRVLQNAKPDSGVLLISLFTLAIISFHMSLQHSTIGYLFISEDITTTLYQEGLSETYYYFLLSYIALMFSYSCTQILSLLQNQTKLVIMSVFLSILCLFGMLNYFEKEIEKTRYTISFLNLSIAYGMCRYALIRQISSCLGEKYFRVNITLIKTVEIFGFTLGSIWGLVGVILIQSIFTVYLSCILLFTGLVILYLVKIEYIMSPHWSIQIQLQEQTLLQYMYQNGNNFGRNYYESLDSGEQARDLPLYFGNEQHSNDYDSRNYRTRRNLGINSDSQSKPIIGGAGLNRSNKSDSMDF
ncbi:UNKNOWN [Stylonychia lemnae]|uniref:Transmembrane protein n=1 Tax=Stylonychia lemnae TaxID=5949 RepID=A0A078BBK1_STYLE|nr:UNKNOWN [Stylonychia lemnae]|eukprot:CDW90938.1 UNKNOWN [Stylonychia lemnae]